jgi:hypothetical protein
MHRSVRAPCFTPGCPALLGSGDVGQAQQLATLGEVDGVFGRDKMETGRIDDIPHEEWRSLSNGKLAERGLGQVH